MADIVKRLRTQYDAWNNPPSPELPDGAGLALEAADEIEKLRKDLSMAVFADTEYCLAMEDDNAKLRAALLDIRDMGPMTVDDQRWRIAKNALETGDE